jgi:hypothetical protein
MVVDIEQKQNNVKNLVFFCFTLNDQILLYLDEGACTDQPKSAILISP